jgi:alginate O-acetyltransferase complex protein AlgI
MLFSSDVFLFFFLPLCVIGYALIFKQARNAWLLAFSLLFYTWGVAASCSGCWHRSSATSCLDC